MERWGRLLATAATRLTTGAEALWRAAGYSPILSESLHRNFKYKLKPTPEQELEHVLMLCRRLHKTALEQRKIAFERCGISLSRYSQEAELKDSRAEMPEYAAMHSHILQDVLARSDKGFQAFFRCIRERQTADYPRFHGRSRYNSFAFKEFGNGRGSITASWSCPSLGASLCAGPAHSRVPQDDHGIAASGRLVCLLLLCRRADAASPRDGATDGHRPSA
jgi:hypothetical protein